MRGAARYSVLTRAAMQVTTVTWQPVAARATAAQLKMPSPEAMATWVNRVVMFSLVVSAPSGWFVGFA